MGTPGSIELDVGLLYAASLGTTEPTGNTTAQPGPIAGFRAVGYTQAGSILTPYKPTVNPIYVEEEYYPIRQVVSQVDGMVDFVIAEMNRTNLALANNAGANAVNDASSFQPVTPGAELPVILMWESTVIGERWVFRSCIQTAAVAIPRRKAPNMSVIPVSFALIKPAGVQPWICFPSAGALV
jgi:hypothetical protein